MTSLEIAAPDGEPERLDKLLARQIPELSRTMAARLIESGAVLVNGKPAVKSRLVLPGELIHADIPDPTPLAAAPQDIPLHIVYEDGDLLVVDKPKGMVVHPAPGNPDGTLVNALLYHCAGSLSGIGGALRPGIVHRIDKMTSGLLIAAKNDFAHRRLAAQIGAHSFERAYEAVAAGRFARDAGTVDAPIGRDPGNRKRMAVRPEGKPAVTHFEVLERFARHTHLRLTLETGRTHQIRVHLSSIGHPVAGDALYGGPPVPGLDGQCLHAAHIGFVHPRTGETLRFDSPLPAYFEATLKYCGRLR